MGGGHAQQFRRDSDFGSSFVPLHMMGPSTRLDGSQLNEAHAGDGLEQCWSDVLEASRAAMRGPWDRESPQMPLLRGPITKHCFSSCLAVLVLSLLGRVAAANQRREAGGVRESLNGNAGSESDKQPSSLGPYLH